MRNEHRAETEEAFPGGETGSVGHTEERMML
jgi:hypothetical protein